MSSIVDSTCPSVSNRQFDLRLLGWTCEVNGAGLKLTVETGNDGKFDVWIAVVNHTSAINLHEGVKICEDFFNNASTGDCRIFTFSFRTEDIGRDWKENPIFLVVIESNAEGERERSNIDEDPVEISDKQLYEDRPLLATIKLRTANTGPRRLKANIFLAATLIGAIILLLIFSQFSSQSADYERYPTPGSIGPKHQGRLLYNNATAWAREHYFDDSKWKVRIDDQAIIPAALYDASEERYQRWFQQRYPHLQAIIERHDHLRPSWLGSSQIAVPWDEQFHFAHCVLALRRYWTAKETGSHVCGRDIDYAHMKHCLDSLDEKAFPPGPMDNVDKDYTLWWQTKVCYN